MTCPTFLVQVLANSSPAINTAEMVWKRRATHRSCIPSRWPRISNRSYATCGAGANSRSSEASPSDPPSPVTLLHPLTGGVECLHLPQASAGFVNRFLAQFVTSVAAQPETLAQAAADAESLPKKLAEHLKPALIRMADWTEQTNPDTAKAMRKREPKSIFSFSRTPAEGVAGMEAL